MTEKIFRKEHYNLLLAQMIRSPTIRDLALEHLEPRFFTNPVIGGTPVQAIIFTIIKDYYAMHKIAPDDGVMMVELDIYLKKWFSAEAREIAIRESVAFMALIKLVDERSEQHARKMLQFIADICVYKVALDDAIKQYKETGAVTELRENIIEVESKQAVLRGGMAVNNILDMDEDEMGMRVSTHIPWLDARFGRGAGPSLGSVLSIIAPQGGGKTTLGIQLGVAQALIGRYALLALAEEGLSPQIRAKIYGCALGLDWTKIEMAPPPKYRDKVLYAVKEARLDEALATKKMGYIGEYLCVLDLVNRNAVADALEAIDGELSMMRSQNKIPSYVYVDWAGIICDAVAGRSGRPKREELQTFSYKLSELSQRHNNIIAVSHQMAPAEAQKGAFARHDQYCAAECRGFTEPHKYVFVINPKDTTTSYQLLQVPKSRNDQPPEQAILRLRGEHSVFDDVTSRCRMQGKKFIANRCGKENAVPVEH